MTLCAGVIFSGLAAMAVFAAVCWAVSTEDRHAARRRRREAARDRDPFLGDCIPPDWEDRNARPRSPWP